MAAAECVPVNLEPHHHFRWSNGFVRIYDGIIEGGSETQFHEHRRDTVYVALTPVACCEHFLDKPDALMRLEQNSVFLREHAQCKLIHKLRNQGADAVWFVGVEILTTEGGTEAATTGADDRRHPCLDLCVSNDKCRVYKLLTEVDGHALKAGGPGVLVFWGEVHIGIRKADWRDSVGVQDVGKGGHVWLSKGDELCFVKGSGPGVLGIYTELIEPSAEHTL